MSKKVRQTITIDVERLENAFVWHLNLDDALQKLSELEHIRKLSEDEILDLIKECRLQLTSLDMTLSEFQEIYEALTTQEAPPAPTTPQLLKEETQNEIKEKFINNFMSNLDKTKK